MTPKEKAKELVDKIFDKMFDLRDGYNSTEVYNAAKQCALIAVNEILKILNDYWNQDCKINNTKIGYYEEVKQEIELL